MTLNPLQPAFDRIHDSLYIYTPPEAIKKQKNRSEPDTILFLAWGNAPPKNIVKYTNRYQTIYPGARIIVFLTSFADLVLHTAQRQTEPLSPAVKAILAAGDGAKTLVHLFSNGGSYKLRELALAYRRTTGRLLPLELLVLDSAPGLPDFWRSIVAFQTQLPRSLFFYYLGTLAIYLFMIVRYIWGVTTGQPPITAEVWEMLNDQEIIDVKARRLYMWSKTDELIDWHDIKLHAGDAKQKGYTVTTVEFPGSRHVAHVMVDKDKYWNTITQAWELSQSSASAN